jgi:cold shock CspA family protein
MEGRVRSAKFSASSNDWFGQIARDGQSDIFFHTSRSPQLDLKGQSIEPGMKVTFVEGKNTSKGKHYGSPIACDIQIKDDK